jgi:21S rRNA (GM2251-2'-O)-methyltransferase
MITAFLCWNVPRIGAFTGTVSRRLYRSSAAILLARPSSVRVDDQGRRIRGANTNPKEEKESNDWIDSNSNNEWGSSSSNNKRDNNNYNSNNDNDNDDWGNDRRPSRSNSNSKRGGGGQGGGQRGPYNNRRRQGDEKEADDRKINMRALEGAGFVHLYGLACCLNALSANRRDFRRPEDSIDLSELQGQELELEIEQRNRKPQAQYSPWLFVQDSTNAVGRSGSSSSRSSSKSQQAQQVIALAKERGIPVASVDKGVLNTLSGNRPHQGYVLRCGKLDFEQITEIPMMDNNNSNNNNSLWLVLDQVVDPQNLGALLRSVYFLDKRIQVLVCAKNSAPPSATVSAASAGALELLQVYSTSNLIRTLDKANQAGCQIVGASSSVPKDLVGSGVELYNALELKLQNKANVPTLLVLGSEGHGLRPLVIKSCTALVRIVPGGTSEENNEKLDDENDDTQQQDVDVDGDNAVMGVDSLNVSVTGGILLWQFLQQLKWNDQKVTE